MMTKDHIEDHLRDVEESGIYDFLKDMFRRIDALSERSDAELKNVLLYREFANAFLLSIAELQVIQSEIRVNGGVLRHRSSIYNFVLHQHFGMLSGGSKLHLAKADDGDLITEIGDPCNEMEIYTFAVLSHRGMLNFMNKLRSTKKYGKRDE